MGLGTGSLPCPSLDRLDAHLAARTLDVLLDTARSRIEVDVLRHYEAADWRRSLLERWCMQGSGHRRRGGPRGRAYLSPRPRRVFCDIDEPFQSRQRYICEELLALMTDEADDFAPH